jgi:hypothetical protein
MTDVPVEMNQSGVTVGTDSGNNLGFPAATGWLMPPGGGLWVVVHADDGSDTPIGVFAPGAWRYVRRTDACG